VSRRPEDTLHLLREVAVRAARARLREAQARISEQLLGLVDLRRRSEAIIARGGACVLEERRLLEALTRRRIEKTRELEQMTREASRLLARYREARDRRDAVERLRERRKLEREAVLERRTDEAAGAIAAWRVISARGEGGEGAP
jgi:hypothetical protein